MSAAEEVTRNTSTRFKATILTDLNKWGPVSASANAKVAALADVNSDQQKQRACRPHLSYDRATAARLGITPAMIDATLYDAFGQRQVSNYVHAVESVPRRDGSRAAAFGKVRKD